MKHKKSIIIALILFLLMAGLAGNDYFKKRNNNPDVSKVSNTKSVSNEKNYLLEGYPEDEVPLYKMKMVSSAKYFVNKDPGSSGGYFGQPVNYFNVVFETEATPKELLSYYRSLMSQVNEERVSEEKIEGAIGKYKVSASHFGNNPKNYAYLQVYLPTDEYSADNPYYGEYPKMVEMDDSWIEYESSYGLLNQNGGEVEYTQYFPLIREEKEREELIAEYLNKYQSEKEFNYNAATGLMMWKKENYTVYLTFSKGHGRIYLMMRRPM